MPRYRRPEEYARLRRELTNTARGLGIDLNDVFAKAERARLASPAAPATPVPAEQPVVIPAADIIVPSPEPEPGAMQFTQGEATGNFGQPVEIPVVQPNLPVGYSGSGLPKAEQHPAVPANAPYYVDLCIICQGRMYTRDPREDCCENCCYLLRDDATTSRLSMESKAGGKLVDPFKD